MDELIFEGEIIKGSGKHKELIIPGRHELSIAPTDWPERLFPGSLNVLIRTYPVEFSENELPHTVTVLDTCGFEPAFTIEQSEMGNNLLVPTPEFPLRGKAQVWPATLQVNRHEVRAWVLRRIRSGFADKLELVGGEKIRDCCGIADENRNWPATVRMIGRWS